MNESNPNDNRWQRLKAVFNEVVELAPERRSSYLSALRLNEKTFYQEIAELIAIDRVAEDFLDEPVALEFDSPSAVGETIGHYRIAREIERGGMGVVYEAARFDDAFEQRVAIKLVNRHFFTGELTKRFVKERQILARLEHPNIVRLLDGGLTDDRTPYYVMEFIEGTPVDVYCRENNPDTNEKLKFFLQICSAVAYAHRQLIVHRDLKPSNILITKTGEAKLLDFGIAKILDANADMQTQTQNAPLTPAYASPEQIRGETIATASDIYSLGIILYELLTGKSPREIYAVSQMDIPRGICEIEPAAPSRANSQLKGDLDNIVLKALRKEKARRYDSVEQFADDIESYLDGLPVKAHPQSFQYRAAKFVKRNRLAVALAAAAILLITGGVFAAVWQSFEARKQQQIAEQRFNQVRKIANSLILEYHDEIAKLDGSIKLREKLVSDGVNYLDAVSQEEIDNPYFLKEMGIAYRKIGNAQGEPYRANLGRLEDAIQSYQKAVALLEKASLVASSDISIKDELIKSYRLLANAETRSGNKEQAQLTLQKALTLNKELIASDENNVERKISSLNLQIALGDAGYGIEPFEQALEEGNALYLSEPQNENLIVILKRLHSRISTFLRYRGKSEQKKGNLETAQNWYLQSLEHSEREVYYAKSNPDAMTDKRWIYDAYHNHAEGLSKVGRIKEALENLEIAEKILQDLKKNNTDDREIVFFEIWFLSLKRAILKQQSKPEAALAVTETALKLALEYIEADPTNVEMLMNTLNLADEAANLASGLKKTRQAENYRQICLKYEKQYKERFGENYGYVF